MRQTLSLVGVIIGEFLAAKAGLGYLIIYGSQVFKLDELHSRFLKIKSEKSLQTFPAA